MTRRALRSALYGVALLPFAATLSCAQPEQIDLTAEIASYRSTADRIIEAALADSAAYDRLAQLTDFYPHRLSGSKGLEDAIDWIVDEMKSDGLENVRTQPVLVPHWVRGEESIEIVSPVPRPIPMLGLGGSISTPQEGIEGEVLVVSSFDDLESRPQEAEGKIVLFNVPFTTYGETVQYRRNGAVAAARAGAIASMIRSVTPYGLQTPHAGSMRYEEGVRKIPHAAITIEEAEYMQRMSDRGVPVRVRMKMGAQTFPDAMSRNVIAEVVGSELPDEVVVIGGHIDSWDVGTGAMDDGSGCVATWEALRIIKDLGLRPRRTIRLVLWTNEENGLRGALAYRDSVASVIDKHVLAIEADAGMSTPTGFGVGGSDSAHRVLSEIGTLLAPIQADSIAVGGGGADIGPLMREGVPGMGLRVDPERYFWYHHSPADTIDKLDPRDVALGTAAVAVMAFVAADLSVPIPR